jgi:large subunit ribosomal protein LP0
MRVNGMTEKEKRDFPQLKEQKLPKVKALMELLENKIAFIFTDTNVNEFKKAISKVPIPREAKVGSIAPCDVAIPEGPTGLPPAEVNFFHALGIQVRINKGILDLQKAVNLIKKGDKVGNSEAGLLKKLNMMPFTYPLIFDKIYEDGNIYPASMLEVSSEDIISKIQTHVKSLAALSLEVNHVNALSAPLLVLNSFKQMLAIGLETGYEMEALKQASASTTAAPASSGGAPTKKEEKAAPEPVKEEKVEEPVEEGFGGLFDF